MKKIGGFLLMIMSIVLLGSCNLLRGDLVVLVNSSGGTIATGAGSTSFNVKSSVSGEVVYVEKVIIQGLTFTPASDLKISLIAPDGTSVVLSNNEGGSNQFNGGDYTFVNAEHYTDMYTTGRFITYTGDVVPAAYEPYGSLSKFDELAFSSNDNWELRIYNSNTTNPGSITGILLYVRYNY